jgi:hypothetical protein
MMKKPKKFQLARWFIDFANTDLAKINTNDRMKLQTDAISIIYEMSNWLTGDGSEQIMPADRWGDGVDTLEQAGVRFEKENILENCQTKLREALSKIEIAIEDSKQSASEWGAKSNNYIFFDQLRMPVRLRLEMPLVPNDTKAINGGKELQFKLKSDELMNTPFSSSMMADTHEDTFLIHFYRSLAALPIGALRRCPNCGNYYLHLTQKERTYCSNRCAAAYRMREKRQIIKDTDPEAYEALLKEEAKRSRDNYVKKVPHGKPARRPYKYKDE